MMFKKVLIANRGEIACRVVATCRRLGVQTVAVYSDADRASRHVKLADEAWHIGGPRPLDSYLRIDRILEVAKASHAEAIHPGYGFLSENAAFARACAEVGITFIGPTPEAIEKMGSKSAAKSILQQAGVPVVPGYHGAAQELKTLQTQADKIGYPLLVKAVAGGGGKGMRLVTNPGEFTAQLEAAQREAKSAFADDSVLLERFVQGPHHIEFQVFGDNFGNVVHLYERECSIQRRHQKVLEETPSPFLDDRLRARMGEAAVAAARAIGYRGAGTIEFIVGADREFFFMEMNTRLQVEHPITEMTTGVDLVEWQLRVAAGEPLARQQDEITRSGHAIEVRIYAENPSSGFLPEAGTLRRLTFPAAEENIRIDTGVSQGDEVGVFYDPMIAKLIVRGEDRADAIRRLQAALASTAALGIKTNISFLEKLAAHSAFAAGNTDTHFIEQHRDLLLAHPTQVSDSALLAACASALLDADAAAASRACESGDPSSPWHLNNGWRLNGESKFSLMFSDPLSGKTHEVGISSFGSGYQLSIGDRSRQVEAARQDSQRININVDGHALTSIVLHDRLHYCVLIEGERYELFEVEPFAFESAEEIPGGRLTALMPGRIVKVFVNAGDAVTKGQPLLIMEAMKMEHTIHSPRDGVIDRVFYRVDDIVQADAPLFAFVG